MPTEHDDHAICVTVTLTSREYIRLQMRAGLRLMRLMILVMVALFAVSVFPPWEILVEHKGALEPKTDVAVLSAISAVLVLASLPVMLYLGARRRWQAISELREPRTYTFSDSEICVNGNSFQGSFKWNHIARVEQTGDLIALITAQRLIHLIPIRAFSDSTELENFRSLLRTKVANCRLR